MNCEFCQSPAHVWFQCPKKPDGWKPVRLAKESTAARKDVRETEGSTTSRDLGKKLSTDNRKCSSDVGGQKRGSSVASVSEPERLAGTQALPVDTNSSATNGDLTSSEASPTSLAGVEGDKTGAKSIVSPETASQSQYPASRATSEWPETVSRSGGVDGTVSEARTEATAVTAGETAPKFNKVAYQREYMRRRRAKAKEAER